MIKISRVNILPVVNSFRWGEEGGWCGHRQPIHMWNPRLAAETPLGLMTAVARTQPMQAPSPQAPLLTLFFLHAHSLCLHPQLSIHMSQSDTS